MPVWGAHLGADYTGVPVMAPMPVTPNKEDEQTLDDSQSQTTPLQLAVAQQAMEAVAASFLTPVSVGKKPGEPQTTEPVPKRPKPTPVSTPCGSPAANLEMAGLQVGEQAKEAQEFHDAQEAAGKMDVEAGVETQYSKHSPIRKTTYKKKPRSDSAGK